VPCIITDRHRHIGNIFAGQFFFEDEPVDYEFFRSQARKYGFNEAEYIAALEKVPRLSREAVNTSMDFLMTFANMISSLNYSKIKMSKLLSERNTLLEALQKSEEKYRDIVETTNEGVWLFNSEAETIYGNEKNGWDVGM
jgi:PAS domain-containing protein